MYNLLYISFIQQVVHFVNRILALSVLLCCLFETVQVPGLLKAHKNGGRRNKLLRHANCFVREKQAEIKRFQPAWDQYAIIPTHLRKPSPVSTSGFCVVCILIHRSDKSTVNHHTALHHLLTAHRPCRSNAWFIGPEPFPKSSIAAKAPEI